MENTIQLRTEKPIDGDSAYFASLILQDVHQTIRSIHMIVAVLLQYVEIGTSIANSLIRFLYTRLDYPSGQ